MPAITGSPRARSEWEVATSADAPELVADELTFVALDDGCLVLDPGVPVDAAEPLARAVEEHLQPPYRAAALRKDGSMWAVAATRVRVLELPGVEGETLEAARVGGDVSFSVDGAARLAPPTARQLLDEVTGDVAMTGERIDGPTWVVEVWRL